MDAHPPFLTCAQCHDRIGVYEPLWLRQTDGTFRRSSFLNLAKYPQRDPTRHWHLDCLKPDKGSSLAATLTAT
jgi:hypothetical protein